MGFPREAEAYTTKINTAVLPAELQSLRHSLAWPIDMRDAPAQITCYFGDLSYSYLAKDQRDPHFAIDIQAPLHTPVLAPTDARVAIVDATTPMNETRGWTDILLLDEEANLAYWLVHLDTNSIPYKLAREAYFGDGGDLRVKRGEMVGRVGLFFNDWTVKRQAEYGVPPFLHPDVQLDPEVEKVFRRQYDHLHMEIHRVPRSGELSFKTFDPLDPVTLLERLY